MQHDFKARRNKQSKRYKLCDNNAAKYSLQQAQKRVSATQTMISAGR